MAICKFFQQGHCKNGDNCRFEHVRGGNNSQGNNQGGGRGGYQNNDRGRGRGRGGGGFGGGRGGGNNNPNGGGFGGPRSNNNNQNNNQFGAFNNSNNSGNSNAHGNQGNQRGRGGFNQRGGRGDARGGRGGRGGGAFGAEGRQNFQDSKMEIERPFMHLPSGQRGGRGNRNQNNSRAFNDFARLIRDELKPGEAPSWPLSCFAPDPNLSAQLFESEIDMSPEELRMQFVQAFQSGMVEQYQVQEEQIVNEALGKRDFGHTNENQALEYLQEKVNERPNRYDFLKSLTNPNVRHGLFTTENQERRVGIFAGQPADTPTFRYGQPRSHSNYQQQPQSSFNNNVGSGFFNANDAQRPQTPAGNGFFNPGLAGNSPTDITFNESPVAQRFGSVFGSNNVNQNQGPFGNPANLNQGGGPFGQNQNAFNPTSSPFGQSQAQVAQPPAKEQSLFNTHYQAFQQPQQSQELWPGASNLGQQQQAPQTNGFNNNPPQQSNQPNGFFNAPAQPATSQPQQPHGFAQNAGFQQHQHQQQPAQPQQNGFGQNPGLQQQDSSASGVTPNPNTYMQYDPQRPDVVLFFKGKRVWYADNIPYYDPGDGLGERRLWFPRGPPKTNNNNQAHQNGNVKTVYDSARNNGFFQTGEIPEEPPKPAEILWDM